MIKRIEALIQEQVLPALAAHGGSVEVIDIENDKLYIKLSGGCQGCSSSLTTVRDGITTLVKQHFPQIIEVVDMTDHATGQNPYM
jgi:Fe/S biogenesis protein NfuA